MNKLFFKVMAASCCFAFANQASHAAEAVPTSVDMDIASYPINTASGGQPLIMLMLGRDHSMYYEAVLMEYLRRMWFMMVFSNRTGAIPMIQMPECLE